MSKVWGDLYIWKSVCEGGRGVSGARTILEIGHVDEEPAPLCVMIAEDSVVYEFPAECIRNMDNNAFWRYSLWRRSHIGWQTVDYSGGTSRFTFVFRASEAIRAR